MKKLLAFDLDNTLAPSKTDIDLEMKSILDQLLQKYKIAILSSANLERIKRTVVSHLDSVGLKNLLILAVCGAEYYYFDSNNEIQTEYKNSLTTEEVEEISRILLEAHESSELKEDKIYGEQLEHDGVILRFSMIGFDASEELRINWDPERNKRKNFVRNLSEPLSKYDIFISGKTSIDVIKKGFDKSYGMTKLLEINKLEKHEVSFFGDAFYPDGNDYPVLKTDVECISVGNPEDTKNYLRHLL